MSAIKINNLTFSYPGSGDEIFSSLSLSIDSDWKTGLIGRNGRGKTTLIKLISGELPHGGTVSSDVAFDLFPYEIKNPDFPANDIIAEQFPEIETWRVIKELNKLKIDEDAIYRPFSSLSGGERTKIMLGMLFAKENNFLLIDEPTNHLDAESRILMGEYLNKKSGFILVSHDRTLLDSCIDHVISINRSGVTVEKGNFSSCNENRIRKEQFETSRNEKLKKDIKRLDEAAARASAWSDKTEKSKKGGIDGAPRPDRGAIGHKAAKMMKRAKSIESRREQAAEEKKSLLTDAERQDSLKITCLPHPAEVLVRLKNVSLRYGDKTVLDDFSLEIKRGDKIALCGKNGSGKSTVLKLILSAARKTLGNDFPDAEISGEIYAASNLATAYVPQDVSYPNVSVREIAKTENVDETLLKAILAKLGLKKEQFEKNISDFSMGQKKKTALAVALCKRAHLYVMDEPLNYIDVISRIQIEELLASDKPTMIFVEHDAVFTSKIASETKRI